MDRSQRSGGDGWSDVEQRFFETAPPDVPLQPPAPLTFDDLEAPLPERRRRRRARRPAAARKAAPPERRERWSAARRVAARGAAAAIVLLTNLAAHAPNWRRLVPERNAARALAARAVQLALGPVLEQLPAERSNRGTILAAVAAIVIVVGLAAVVGAYGPPLTFIR